jgi:Na+-translocating ferredoxin:NAD+ oxidoreductase subunit C
MTTRSLTRGGLKLETHKRRSTTRPLRAASLPSVLVLPLDQHAGNASRPVVAVGDTVARGQPIAEPSGPISAWLHAPLSGRVRAIEQRPSPLQRTGSLCIEIENDGANRRYDAHPTLDGSAAPHAVCEFIELGGIVGLGGAVFPTGPKLARASEKNAHLIVNGAECEPWISCDDTLMRERADDVIAGALILCRAVQAERCTIAVEDDMPEAGRALREAAQRTGSGAPEVIDVPSIYPAGGERQLIATLTKLEVPSGGLPQDIGVVCHNVGTAAAVARWIQNGEPLIRRIVTMTGSAVKEPANLEALIGTPVSTLIADCGGYVSEPARLIMGGTMMGVALPDDAHMIVKGTNCVIAATAADLQLQGSEMPCIRCGACSEACPAFLLPQELHRFALAGELDNLDRYGLLDCIECGCCDYVCPSQIPLVERFRIAKPALLRHLDTRTMAPLAKSHFDAREARLAQLEAERRAKLAEKRKSITSKPTMP